MTFASAWCRLFYSASSPSEARNVDAAGNVDENSTEEEKAEEEDEEDGETKAKVRKAKKREKTSWTNLKEGRKGAPR